MALLPLPSKLCHAALFVVLTMAGQPALADDAIETKAKVCAGCHGEQGVPIQKVIPVIWGQNAGYLFYQLRDFKSGARKHGLMSARPASRDQADLPPLARYISKLKWPTLAPARARSAVAK